MNQWDADMHITDAMVRLLIESQFPELSGLRIRRIGEGWDNAVYRVGDSYTFRFPRRSIAVELLRTEGRLLPLLDEYITLPYPKPLFYGQESEAYPVPFLGYTYIPGTFPVGLGDEQRRLSAASLARFLRKLHSFPVGTAREAGASEDHRNLTDVAARKEKMVGVLSGLKPHLPMEEYDTVQEYLKRVTVKRITRQEVMLHGDLHFKNMLADERGQIRGVIDWGDLNVGHPGCDLNIAYSFLGPAERRLFFEQYGEVNEESRLLARLIGVFIPMLLLAQAVQIQDVGVAEEARASICRALSGD
ncbi:aminoglycoside phosphotransferase (APT) family kinase protein [Paenibacillus rhizosphaerae]|uniref:Aminoglycoside phosphotransferase (APT) family kinase protein n=1 Tax=Paenibacillus rhizosphaerae TaxID=297318 RepID=A0A839TSL5_9BACL|nr:phosphotransferase [Paenibacillus rhizosphaerae]MBB3127717.1 aminoglycoside phosphotransferase (APT) family kinase protein [Paenibacillus rhizosphaerae]